MASITCKAWSPCQVVRGQETVLLAVYKSAGTLCLRFKPCSLAWQLTAAPNDRWSCLEPEPRAPHGPGVGQTHLAWLIFSLIQQVQLPGLPAVETELMSVQPVVCAGPKRARPCNRLLERWGRGPIPTLTWDSLAFIFLIFEFHTGRPQVPPSNFLKFSGLPQELVSVFH